MYISTNMPAHDKTFKMAGMTSKSFDQLQIYAQWHETFSSCIRHLYILSYVYISKEWRFWYNWICRPESLLVILLWVLQFTGWKYNYSIENLIQKRLILRPLGPEKRWWPPGFSVAEMPVARGKTLKFLNFICTVFIWLKYYWQDAELYKRNPSTLRLEKKNALQTMQSQSKLLKKQY